MTTGAGFNSGWTNRPRMPDFSNNLILPGVEELELLLLLLLLLDDDDVSRHQTGRQTAAVVVVVLLARKSFGDLQ